MNMANYCEGSRVLKTYRGERGWQKRENRRRKGKKDGRKEGRESRRERWREGGKNMANIN